MEPNFFTRFTITGLDIGWVSVISRRELITRFGQTFGYVKLASKRFPGFKYFGSRDVPFEGSPVCLLSLRDPKRIWTPSWADDERAERWSRPSIEFYVHREADIESWNWTVAELFDQVERQLQEWGVNSEFNEQNTVSVLYCTVNGSLREVISVHHRGSR